MTINDCTKLVVMTIKQVAIVTCFVNLKFECLYSNYFRHCEFRM